MEKLQSCSTSKRPRMILMCMQLLIWLLMRCNVVGVKENKVFILFCKKYLLIQLLLHCRWHKPIHNNKVSLAYLPPL
jgi:hypothetical protein